MQQDDERDPTGDWRDQYTRISGEWRSLTTQATALLLVGAVIAYFNTWLGPGIGLIGIGLLLTGVGRILLAVLEVQLWKVDP